MSTVLIIQLAIPICLLVNSTTIKSQYHILHWIGAGLILVGTVLNTVANPVLGNASLLTDSEKDLVVVNW